MNLHRSEPGSAIAADPGENDRNGLLTPILGQRDEKTVYRTSVLACGRGRLHLQQALRDGQRRIRWDDIHMVADHFLAIHGLRHGHSSVWGQKLNQHAGMMRVQMLDQNECLTGVGRHVAQEGSEGGKPTRRCADADDQAELRPMGCCHLAG